MTQNNNSDTFSPQLNTGLLVTNVSPFECFVSPSFYCIFAARVFFLQVRAQFKQRFICVYRNLYKITSTKCIQNDVIFYF